jgi:hypothetical protein
MTPRAAPAAKYEVDQAEEPAEGNRILRLDLSDLGGSQDSLEDRVLGRPPVVCSTVGLHHRDHTFSRSGTMSRSNWVLSMPT